MQERISLAWDRFKIIGSIIGDIQGRLIALIFYFTILVPFGIISRLFNDSLDLHSKPSWLPREAVENELEAAKRQG